MLELISTSWPNSQLIPWPSALIGGPAQDVAGGPPSRSPIKRRWRLAAHDMRFTAAARTPHLETLIRSERVGCSGGKCHHRCSLLRPTVAVGHAAAMCLCDTFFNHCVAPPSLLRHAAPSSSTTPADFHGGAMEVGNVFSLCKDYSHSIYS